MYSFSQEVPLNDERITFSFNRISTVNGIKYFITAKGKNRNQCSFEMELRRGEWKIITAPKVCEQILNMEEELSKVIKDSLND